MAEGPLHVDAAPPEPVEGALAAPRCVPRDRRGRGAARRAARSRTGSQTNTHGVHRRASPSQEGELAQFGLGEALLRVYSLLDGRTRLGELAGKVRSPEARLNLLRLTYLLVQTDLARLS